MQELLAEIVAALLVDPATIDAVVADGWPRPMAEAGFALHARTWDIAAMAAALEHEMDQLPGFTTVPASVTHVWPALPGAGVAPLLYAALLGVPRQQVRASRRGAAFARHFVELWRRYDAGLTLVDTLAPADRYVVSGSDETVARVIQGVGAERVVGYGDRQSFAVVVPDPALDLAAVAEGVAVDVAMWFGKGCFSAHAVFFVGAEPRAREFGALLADALRRREDELLGGWADDGMAAARMQGLGLAEFQTTVWPARLGWVELRSRWDGAPRPANAVVLCPCADPAAVIELDVAHRQGVAWAGPGAERAASLGVTRICRPGELQAPEPAWPHDGVSNAAALLGLHSGRIGL